MRIIVGGLKADYPGSGHNGIGIHTEKPYVSGSCEVTYWLRGFPSGHP